MLLTCFLNERWNAWLCETLFSAFVWDQEKQRMTDKLEDTSLRLRDEMDLYKKMMDKLRQNRQQFQKEKEEMQEVGGTGSFLFYLLFAISSEHCLF